MLLPIYLRKWKIGHVKICSWYVLYKQLVQMHATKELHKGR